MRCLPTGMVVMIVLGLCGGLAVRTVAQDGPRDREAMQLVVTRCGICHSTDLVMQQRLDRPHWTATVDKMIRWGALLSSEERTVLVNYLADRYHQNAPEQEPVGHREAADGGPSIRR